MKREDIKKFRVIKKQLQDIEKKEKKLLNKKEIKWVHEKVVPIQEKIENKIPVKLQSTLEGAFESGFRLVFKKGIGVIEKSYNKENKSMNFDINDYAVKRQVTHKNIKKIDKIAQKSILGNHLMTTVEGSSLGLLGIGLPDIPIFIAMILKTIYEISLSYGFDYTTEKEKIYILYIICASVTKEDIQKAYNKKLNTWVEEGIHLENETLNIDEIIKETAHHLADSMLTAKFIQGLPLVGVLGGVWNYKIAKSVSRMAHIKYKKRYLLAL